MTFLSTLVLPECVIMLDWPDEEGRGRVECVSLEASGKGRIGKDLRVQDFQNLTMLPPTGQNFQDGFYQYCFLTLNNEKHAKW